MICSPRALGRPKPAGLQFIHGILKPEGPEEASVPVLFNCAVSYDITVSSPPMFPLNSEFIESIFYIFLLKINS